MAKLPDASIVCIDTEITAVIGYLLIAGINLIVL